MRIEIRRPAEHIDGNGIGLDRLLVAVELAPHDIVDEAGQLRGAGDLGPIEHFGERPFNIIPIWVPRHQISPSHQQMTFGALHVKRKPGYISFTSVCLFSFPDIHHMPASRCVALGAFSDG